MGKKSLFRGWDRMAGVWPVSPLNYPGDPAGEAVRDCKGRRRERKISPRARRESLLSPSEFPQSSQSSPPGSKKTVDAS
jgi:hypothetical protein